MGRFLVTIGVFCAGLFANGVIAADTNNVWTKGQLVVSMAEEENTPGQFFKCCWAEGRSAFHYCSEYGICTRDRKETCVGVGAAEGLQLSCSSPPLDRDARPASR